MRAELNRELIAGASADWQTVLPDGTALGDVRYTLRTEGGELSASIWAGFVSTGATNPAQMVGWDESRPDTGRRPD